MRPRHRHSRQPPALGRGFERVFLEERLSLNRFVFLEMFGTQWDRVHDGRFVALQRDRWSLPHGDLACRFVLTVLDRAATLRFLGGYVATC